MGEADYPKCSAAKAFTPLKRQLFLHLVVKFVVELVELVLSSVSITCHRLSLAAMPRALVFFKVFILRP